MKIQTKLGIQCKKRWEILATFFRVKRPSHHFHRNKPTQITTDERVEMGLANRSPFFIATQFADNGT